MKHSRDLLTFVFAGVLLVSLVALPACGSGGQNKKMSSLHSNITTFHNAMRTGRYHEASRYLKRAEQEVFIGRYEELGDDFKIVEIGAKSVDIEKDGNVAHAEAEVRWYRLPSMTVQKDKVKETWRYLNDDWVLVERKVEPAKKNRRSTSSQPDTLP